VPDLRDGFIVDKVGNFRGSENPETLNPIRALGLERYQQDGDSHSVKSATLSHRSAAGDPARLLQGADKFMRHVKLRPSKTASSERRLARSTRMQTAFSCMGHPPANARLRSQLRACSRIVQLR
jgi:hypothetical protein